MDPGHIVTNSWTEIEEIRAHIVLGPGTPPALMEVVPIGTGDITANFTMEYPRANGEISMFRTGPIWLSAEEYRFVIAYSQSDDPMAMKRREIGRIYVDFKDLDLVRRNPTLKNAPPDDLIRANVIEFGIMDQCLQISMQIPKSFDAMVAGIEDNTVAGLMRDHILLLIKFGLEIPKVLEVIGQSDRRFHPTFGFVDADFDETKVDRSAVIAGLLGSRRIRDARCDQERMGYR